MSNRRIKNHRNRYSRSRRRRGRRSGRSEYLPNVQSSRFDLVRTKATRELILSPDAEYTSLGGNSDWLASLNWWCSAISKICTVLSAFASSENGFQATAVPIGCIKILPIVPADFIIATSYKHSISGISNRKASLSTNFSQCRLLRLKVIVEPAVASSEIRGEIVLAVIDTLKQNDGPYQEIKLMDSMTFDEIIQNFHGKRVSLSGSRKAYYNWSPKNGSNASKMQSITMVEGVNDYYNVGHCCTVIIGYRNLSFTSLPTAASFTPSNAQLRVTLKADIELSTPVSDSKKCAAFIYHQNYEKKYAVECFGRSIDVDKSRVLVKNGVLHLKSDDIEALNTRRGEVVEDISDGEMIG